MKLVAILPVRNEDWVLGLSARAILMWCDMLLILDHWSGDGTRQIWADLLSEYPGRVGVLEVNDPTWHEMAHRQRLLEVARGEDATHIVTVDADEVLTGDLLPSIRPMVESLPAGRMLSLPWLQLRNSVDRVHNTGMWGAPHMNVSTAFRDEPALHWTAATRGGYDHHHREPMGRAWAQWDPTAMRYGLPDRASGLMHLQFLSDRRLKAKQYLYQLTERKRWPGKHHGGAVSGVATMVGMYARTVNEHLRAPGSGAPVPDGWWAPYAHLMQHLHIDREPWQIAEIKRLIRENPGIEVGLDSFGLEL